MRLSSLFGRGRTVPRERLIHLPDDLLKPGEIVILAGPSGYDVWTSLFLANTVQRSLPDTRLQMVVSTEDADFIPLLDRTPAVATYSFDARRRRIAPPDDLPDSQIVFFISERPEHSLRTLVRMYPDSVRIFTRPDEDANLVFNLAALPAPSRMHGLARLLGAEPDTSWKPSMSRNDLAAASDLLSPVSGKVLPYMAATEKVAETLRRRGAEFPMRLVLLDGKNSPVAARSPATRAAVLAGASVVATDDPVHWAQASALGVPVIGMDRNATFPVWGKAPSRDAASLAEAWVELIRTGW